MSKILNLLALLTAVFTMSAMSETFQLSEKSLHQLAEKGSPELDQIEAAFLGAAVQTGQIQEKYAPELFGQGAYAETKERALTPVMPIFSPVKQAQLGVRKNFAQGFDTSASIVTDQRSSQNPFIGRLQDVTTTTVAFTTQMDLWKNLLGRMSKAELETATLNNKRAQIEKEIQEKSFNIALRRLYWSLVANNESFIISEGLLKTATKQLEEAKQRLKNSVAEPDEVARYEAQLASREGTKLYLQFQKEILLKQLRNLLPELANKNVVLAQYDLGKTVTSVLACTATISQEASAPYKFTKYDEVVSLLKQIKSNNAIINSRYADPDVKLFGTLKSTGIGSDTVSDRVVRGNYGDSFDDQTEHNRTGYEVGVSFTVPLGDVKESTAEVKRKYDEKRLDASIKSSDIQLVTTHEQLSKSIGLLTQVIRAQKVSSEQLSKRLTLSRKKYQQARVSVDQLVLDQDALLNSELITIDTQLQILNTIFDYLVIYTETPCEFNRI